MPIESTFHDGGLHGSDRKTMEMILGGSGLGALAGVVTLVLSILGLAGIMPLYLAAIGVIVLGVGFLSQGAAVASRYTQLLNHLRGGHDKSIDMARGVTIEFVGGLAGVVLGVMALLGFAPMAMIGSALLVFGATLLLSSAEIARLGSMDIIRPEEDQGRQYFHIAASAAPGGQILVGIAAVVLGIIALTTTVIPLTAALSGLLAVSASLIFSGTAVAGRLMNLFR